MSGSRPEPDPVTASTGTAAGRRPPRAAIAVRRAVDERRARVSLWGPRFDAADAARVTGGEGVVIGDRAEHPGVEERIGLPVGHLRVHPDQAAADHAAGAIAQRRPLRRRGADPSDPHTAAG